MNYIFCMVFTVICGGRCHGDQIDHCHEDCVEDCYKDCYGDRAESCTEDRAESRSLCRTINTLHKCISRVSEFYCMCTRISTLIKLGTILSQHKELEV